MVMATNLFDKIERYFKRTEILEGRNWFRNMKKGYVHPHCLAVVSRKELMNMDDDEFNMLIR